MAASNAIITFERPNKSRFSVSAYLDDTNTNPVRFSRDAKAIATSPDYLQINELCAIVDVVIVSATGQTTTIVKVNDMPVSNLINAVHLASVAYRPDLAIVAWPGNKLTMTQLA